MNTQEVKKKRRVRRKYAIRKNINGTAERLRLTVFKSNEHIYVQLINDEEQKTVLSASTIDKEVRDQIKSEMPKIMQSKLVGQAIAKRALDNNIKKVAFDRNGYLYHGRIKALADAAREAGLEF